MMTTSGRSQMTRLADRAVRTVLFSVTILLLLMVIAGCFDLDVPTACGENVERCTSGTSDSDTNDSGVDSSVVDEGADSFADDAAETSMEDSTIDGGGDVPADTITQSGDTSIDTAPVCAASSYTCVGDELRQCKSDGSGYTSVVTCPTGTCSASSKRCTFCVPDTLGCAGTQPTKCNALGSAFAANGSACVAPQTCGGGGATGVCGCTPTPTTTVCAGKECGMVDNGCGLVSCGTCTGPKTCGGGGTANKCGGCGGTLPGPPMINAGGFCIDTTEVTQAQYKAFLDAKGTDFSGQPSMCASRPYASSGGPGCVWSPSTTPNLPVMCIDWCQASAYCKWAGKRLCGKIGGGATPLSDFASTTVDQWYKACTVNGSV